MSNRSIFSNPNQYYTFNIREDLIDDSKDRSIGLTIERCDGIIYPGKSYFSRSYAEVINRSGEYKTVRIAKWLYDKRKKLWSGGRIHTG